MTDGDGAGKVGQGMISLCLIAVARSREKVKKVLIPSLEVNEALKFSMVMPGRQIFLQVRVVCSVTKRLEASDFYASFPQSLRTLPEQARSLVILFERRQLS